MAKGTTITVDLGSRELLRKVELASAEQGRTVQDIVVEALREWFRRREDEEDLRAMMEAEEEYRRIGGRTLEEVLSDLENSSVQDNNS